MIHDLEKKEPLSRHHLIYQSRPTIICQIMMQYLVFYLKCNVCSLLEIIGYKSVSQSKEESSANVVLLDTNQIIQTRYIVRPAKQRTKKLKGYGMGHGFGLQKIQRGRQDGMLQ